MASRGSNPAAPQEKGTDMLYELRNSNTKVGTMQDFYTDDDTVFVLDVDWRVKVSEHHHTFKEFGIMAKYLDWLLGTENWSLKAMR